MIGSFGIFDWFGYDLPYLKRYQYIKEAGFDHVMLWWGDEFNQGGLGKVQYLEMARATGLQVENVHFSYLHTNALWLDNEAGEAVFRTYCGWIQQLAQLQVPTIVLHCAEANPPDISTIGLDRFKAMAQLAEEQGIHLAVENTTSLTHLEAVLKHCPSQYLGFCYDSGHEQLLTESGDLLKKYGNRLKALHLHDNHGDKDEHNLPGEGTIPWGQVMAELKGTGYPGPLTLEVAKEYPPKDEEDPISYLNRARKALEALVGME